MSETKPAHSKLGASSMYRWEACPGSVALCETMPNQSSEFAEEGTIAHDYAADWLNGKLPPDDIDLEMLEAITIYVEYVKGIWNSIPAFDGSVSLVEHRFNLSKIHPDLFGTADSVIYDAKNRVLYVTDYKHGAGIPVDVEGNSQLMYYGLGALLSLGVPVTKIVLTIVQPRYNLGAEPVLDTDTPDEKLRKQGIKRVEMDPLDLLEFQDHLYQSAIKTEAKDAPIVSGDHCRFCNAQPICPTLSKEKELAVRADFQPDVLHKLSPEVVGELLLKLDGIETWCKAVRQFAYLEAKNGRTPHGFKLVDKVGRRKWTDPKKVEATFIAMLDDEDCPKLYTAPEFKSPAQVEKAFPKLKDLVNKLAPMVSSGTTLEPESDPRPAVKQLTAKEMFGETT